jgi:hypothetical protein
MKKDLEVVAQYYTKNNITKSISGPFIVLAN